MSHLFLPLNKHALSGSKYFLNLIFKSCLTVINVLFGKDVWGFVKAVVNCGLVLLLDIHVKEAVFVIFTNSESFLLFFSAFW